MSGGAIPASRHSSSTLVGLEHPVIDLHASFSSGSNLEACGDLAQTVLIELVNLIWLREGIATGKVNLGLNMDEKVWKKYTCKRIMEG